MREIPFEKENLQIFENETEIYKGDFEKKMACLTAMEMMNDCLDYIYQLLHPMYPKVYKPRIYLADKNEPNAFAQPTGEADGYIVVFSGLIFSFLNLIEEKYTEDVLKKYKIFEGIPQEEVLSGIRVYFWRYIVLHELYHLWHRHGLWKSLYEFDDNEKVIKMKSELTNFAQGERVEQLKDNSPDARRNMTQQALELDADSSAFCMLVNMLMRDTKQRGLYVEQRNSYIKNEIGFLMAALASAYSLFDNRSGARFEILKSLKECSHPIPAIRMYYAEEIVEGSLKRFFESEEEFEASRDFVDSINFYETHIFKYSKRQGTKAAKMDGQIPEHEKTRRSNIMLELNRKKMQRYEEGWLGKKVEVLFEEMTERDGKNYVTGHTKEYLRIGVPCEPEQADRWINQLKEIELTSLSQIMH